MLESKWLDAVQHGDERCERLRSRDKRREKLLGATTTAGVPVIAIVVSSLVSPLSIGVSLHLSSQC